MDVCLAVMMTGRFIDVTGENSLLDPLQALNTAHGLPPVLVFRSRDDGKVGLEIDS